MTEGIAPTPEATLALGAAAAAPVIAVHAPPFEGPAASWAGFAYLVVGSSLLGYALWFWALGRGGVMRMSVFHLVKINRKLVYLTMKGIKSSINERNVGFSK